MINIVNKIDNYLYHNDKAAIIVFIVSVSLVSAITLLINYYR